MKNMTIDRFLPYLIFILPAIALIVLMSCGGGKKKEEPVKKPEIQSFVNHPEWSRNATIYEVNIRQFTPEGTFNAFAEHLTRLKDMGVDILWLMPVHPIGEKNRKGTLGSYYSVRDYKGINPEFGTMDDFRNLVSRAHALGMKVIIDWVANHTSWDHAWIAEHPEWYTKDSLGNMVSPFDWSDVADLNYDDKELWAAMTDALKFWVVEADIDGYRCDVAGMVPVEFWDQARAELDRIKPVFMLAEAEEPQHHIRAFDMSYAWELHHIFNAIAKGEKNALALETYFLKQDTLFPKDAYRMLFTSNHDENSWQGTEFERMGEGSVCMAVLTATMPGMPLIYNGQESAFNRRLKFFEKDSIDWGDYRLEPFYRQLFTLKHANQPLWNGKWGGNMERISTTADTAVFAFTRNKEGERVFVLANLSGKVNEAKLRGDSFTGSYKEWFMDEEVTFEKGAAVRLKPWEYKVYVLK